MHRRHDRHRARSARDCAEDAADSKAKTHLTEAPDGGTLEHPPFTPEHARLVGSDDELLMMRAVEDTVNGSPPAAAIFSAATQRWRSIAPPPLTANGVWTTSGPVVLGARCDPNIECSEDAPGWVLTARYDAEHDTWDEQPLIHVDPLDGDQNPKDIVGAVGPDAFVQVNEDLWRLSPGQEPALVKDPEPPRGTVGRCTQSGVRRAVVRLDPVTRASDGAKLAALKAYEQPLGSDEAWQPSGSSTATDVPADEPLRTVVCGTDGPVGVFDHHYAFWTGEAWTTLALDSAGPTQFERHTAVPEGLVVIYADWDDEPANEMHKVGAMTLVTPTRITSRSLPFDSTFSPTFELASVGDRAVFYEWQNAPEPPQYEGVKSKGGDGSWSLSYVDF